MTLREMVEAWHQEVAGYSGASCDEAYEFAVRVEQAAFKMAIEAIEATYDLGPYKTNQTFHAEAIRKLAKERAGK